MTSLNGRLRFGVLERDGFRCVYCGRTSKEIELHVDHVVPRAQGGTNEPTNLVSACVDCNQAKSDRLIQLPPHVDLTAPLPPYPSRRMPARQRQSRPTREQVWPIAAGGRRGWPMPDGAWDQECVAPHADGFLPWAAWQRDKDWYVGFYTCDQGHAWTCGHGVTAGWSEIHTYRHSPTRRLPVRGYLRYHLGVEPYEIALTILAYPDQQALGGRMVFDADATGYRT